MKKKKITIIFLILILVFFVFSKEDIPPTNLENDFDEKALIGDTEIKIEVASDIQDRIKGLSGRESISDDFGMFFDFGYADFHKIWMKDMNFPIDIVWLDSDLEIVYIKKDVKPETYPESFTAPQKTYYVLELKAGFIDKNDVELGQKLTIF